MPLAIVSTPVTSSNLGKATDDQQQGPGDLSGGGFTFIPCDEEPTPDLRLQSQQPPQRGVELSMMEADFDDAMPLVSMAPLGGAASASNLDDDTCSLYHQLIRSKGVQCR